METCRNLKNLAFIFQKKCNEIQPIQLVNLWYIAVSGLGMSSRRSHFELFMLCEIVNTAIVAVLPELRHFQMKNIKKSFLGGAIGSVAPQSKKVVGSIPNLGFLYVQFSCSPCVLIGSPRVLRVPHTIQSPLYSL